MPEKTASAHSGPPSIAVSQKDSGAESGKGRYGDQPKGAGHRISQYLGMKDEDMADRSLSANLAAVSMTGPIQGLFIGALGGISQAAGILVGKRLGAREYDAAYQESKKLMLYGFAGSLILSAVLIALRGPYVLLYHVEQDVQKVSADLLLVFALLAPVKVANMILGGGIIRSGGKTTYIMAIDMAGTWLVGAPLGLVTAFVFHLPIQWVYLSCPRRSWYGSC